jgi:hypothetical protein
MISSSRNVASLQSSRISGHNGLIDRYFYFSMSMLIAVIVVWGFGHTVNDNLIHPAIPRPFLLWIHGAAFSGWVAFYIFQSALVRSHKVKLHRLFGWFGVALATIMVPLGVAIGVIMGRFDKHILHFDFSDTFLFLSFGDMMLFGTFVTLAIAWRQNPELHRRLLLLGTCALLDAVFNRIDRRIFDHSLGFVCADALILFGLARDLLVDRRIHRVYLIALPLMVLFHAWLIYVWRAAPAWWLHLAQSILR